MNENEYIERILAGDSDAYRPLVERYQTGLIIHCENLLKNRDTAEDIAQESFIKAYQRLDSFDIQKARFSTWLYKIATNKCIDELRKQKRHISNGDSLLSNCENISMPLYDDEIIKVRQAVEVLQPPEYSKVIRAYYWEGKSYDQIAAEMGIKSQTIGTWLRRAKLQLKEALT